MKRLKGAKPRAVFLLGAARAQSTAVKGVAKVISSSFAGRDGGVAARGLSRLPPLRAGVGQKDRSAKVRSIRRCVLPALRLLEIGTWIGSPPAPGSPRSARMTGAEQMTAIRCELEISRRPRHEPDPFARPAPGERGKRADRGMVFRIPRNGCGKKAAGKGRLFLPYRSRGSAQRRSPFIPLAGAAVTIAPLDATPVDRFTRVRSFV